MAPKPYGGTQISYADIVFYKHNSIAYTRVNDWLTEAMK